MNAVASEEAPLQISTTLFGDLGRALAYHWLLIVLTGLGTVLCTYLAFQFVPDQYVSTSRLLVKLGRENVELPSTVDKGSLLSTGVRKEEINSEIQLINSRPLIEATVDRLGLEAFRLEPPPPKTWFQRTKAALRGVVREVRATVKEWLIVLNLKPRLSEREQVVLLVTNTLSVEREKDSDVIAISTKLPSGDLAQRVVNTLVELYLERRVEVRRDSGMSDFFDEQLKELRTQLADLDSRRLRLRDTQKMSAVPEERALLVSRLQGLYGQLADDDRELLLLGAGPRASRPASSDSAGAPLSSFPNLEQLRAKATELRLRRTELMQKFMPDAEPAERVSREIAAIETTLQQAITTQQKQRRELAQAIELRLLNLNGGEAALEVIERERLAASQNYQSYQRRREEARVSEAMDVRRVSNIAMLASAEQPIEPVSPRKLLIVALAFPFGLLAGLGVALLLEYLNQTIRDERDLAPGGRGLHLGWLRTGWR
jgi:uncharacterized protein involved in exopolysaccharide biosynthesis